MKHTNFELEFDGHKYYLIVGDEYHEISKETYEHLVKDFSYPVYVDSAEVSIHNNQPQVILYMMNGGNGKQRTERKRFTFDIPYDLYKKISEWDNNDD